MRAILLSSFAVLAVSCSSTAPRRAPAIRSSAPGVVQEELGLPPSAPRWSAGQTLVQGFVGWMTVSFAIIYGFRLTLRKQPPAPSSRITPLYALVPLLIYGGSMVFQALKGNPIETRTIALFAMGIPVLTGLCGWMRWKEAQ